MTDANAALPSWAEPPQAASGMASRFVLEPHAGSMTEALYVRGVLGRGLPFHRCAGWPTEVPTMLGLVEPTIHMRQPDGNEEGLCEVLGEGGYLARVILGDGRIWTQVAADSAESAEELLAAIRESFPRSEPDPEAPRVAVTFWSLGEMGPTSRVRMIDVPAWEDVRDNYPDLARRHLEPLMGDDFEPGNGGQLILWHGPPGTGKTFALRALGWEWREWCDLHYVADPERFFGEKAAYMMDVLLAGDDDTTPETPERHRLARDGRWRLLVLEDTGELMSADARTRSGQGLGRLLNVVDGLIGQGLRILVLVTTNEEVRKLHEAVARPGRCAANVSFPALPRDEAQAWLDENDYDGAPLDRSIYTAAELFATLAAGHDITDPATAERVGFSS